MEIPSPLLLAIEEARGSYPAQALSVAYEALSERYRRKDGEGDLFIRDEAEALAYSAARLPATYAADRKVFDVLAELSPDFTPQSLCDVGAGPGTAVFAALR
ncbi:MAG: methyltransferase type 11, partial [Alphaproteobacteria bacterium]|nr:methyltransferase type 11 [Alphaproteobacteria bacterium]